MTAAIVDQPSPGPLDFEALSKHLADRLIYVVGNARGGSTFTNSAIGIHPQILGVGWNDIVLGRILPQLASLQAAELRRQMLRPETGKHYDEIVAVRNIGKANLRRWNVYVDHVCRSRDLRQLLCLQGLLYWIMHRPTADPGDCFYWCIKENTWAGIERLKRIMPKTRLVFVQRDPRSNALSFAKVYARARKEHFNDRDITRGALDWLRNAAEFALRLNHYNDSLLVYFEELLSDPPPVLNHLYSELGLEALPPSNIHAALDNLEYTSTKTFEERGRENPTGVHPESLTRWQSQLSGEQIALVGALTKAAADYYGYQIEAPRARSIVSALGRAGVPKLPKSLLTYGYCRLRILLLQRAQ